MSADTLMSQWFCGRLPDPAASFRVFCFPFAGGGASSYGSWLKGRSADIDLLPLQPPGRETRIREAPIVRMPEMVGAIAEVIAPWLDRPFAFFGHSLGSVVSFEVARRLRAAGGNTPRLLVASARTAPQIAIEERAIHMADRELIEKLRSDGGTPEDVLREPELLALLLPLLRADFALLASYLYQKEPPLDCPIAAYAGVDDAEVPIPQVRAWADQTDAPFRLRLFPGGHFFIKQRPLEVLGALFSDLAPYLESRCVAHSPGS